MDELLKKIEEGHVSDTGELQWITHDELQAKGLSSGVKKVLKLYTDSKGAEKNSISKFFKPVAKK